MPDLGLEVLLKGSNMLRLLQGLWVALRISLIAVVISIPLGLLFGVLMTRKNVVLKAIFRVYLEFIRIMPQLVLLFLFYFSTTRTFGWNLSGETASIIVFVLWGTAEMSDLVAGGTDLHPKTSVREQCGAGTYQNADLSLRYHSTGRQETDPAVHQPDHTNDQDDQPDLNDRCCRGVEGGTADYRGKPDVQPECSVWNLSDRIFIVFYRMLANQYACKISGKEMEVIFLGTDIVIYRTFEKKL